MLTISSDFVPGKEIKACIGLVMGSAITSQGLGSDLVAAFKSFKGGEIESYTELLDSARRIAYDRMTEEATRLGADAVISVRFVSSSLMQGAAEILVYGTAVRFKEAGDE